MIQSVSGNNIYYNHVLQNKNTASNAALQKPVLTKKNKFSLPNTTNPIHKTP